MDQKLIVTDSVRDTNYLVREWNRAGNDLVNREVISLTDLEREIALYVIADLGRDLKREVGPNAAAFLVQKILLKGIADGDVNYFRSGGLDYKTCQEIYSKLDTLRESDLTDDFTISNDLKIMDLRWLLGEYKALLERNQWMDHAGFLDLAVSEHWAERWHAENPCEIETVLFGETASKEKRLLEKLGAVKANRFTNLYVQPHSLHFVKAYGAVNEARYIADEIGRRALPYGDVAVYYTSDVYEGYLKSVFGAAGIPYAFVTGRAGEDEDYIALAVTILKWAEGGYRYEDLLPVFTSPVIRESGGVSTYNNELNSGIGMTLERYQNYIQRSEKELAKINDSAAAESRQVQNRKSFLDTLNSLVGIFSEKRSCYGYLNSVIQWLESHTSLRTKNRKKDLDVLRNLLPDALLIPVSGSDDAVPALLDLLDDLKVKDAESSSVVSILHLGDPGVSERPYNFFIGLSAKELEYSTADSPVLSDDELVLFTGNTAPRLAKEETVRRTEALRGIIASVKGEVTLSYSFYDLVNLLQQTGSSFYHDCLVKSGLKETATGFDGSLSRSDSKNVGIHIGGDILEKEFPQVEEPDSDAEEKTPQELIRDWLAGYTFSASSLKTYDECPRHFYYHYILRLPDIQQPEYKPDQWLSGADLGNFFHGVLQAYVQACFIDEQQDSFDQDFFDHVFQQQIDTALEKTMYVSESAFHTECKEYREELTAYLKHLHDSFVNPEEGSDWKVEAVEYPVYEPDGKTGIVIDPDCPDVRFGGRLDRIDSWTGADGKRHYRIVDYKTSRRDRLQKEVDEGEGGTKPKQAARRQHDVYMALYPAAESFEYDLVVEDPANEDPIRKVRKEEKIQRIAEQLESSLYPTEGNISFSRGGTIGKSDCCRYCTFHSLCRLYSSGT